jgi:hypothetical protein
MTYEEIIHKSGLPVLKLDLKYPFGDIYNELLALKALSVTQIGNENWKGCTLRGYAADKPRPYYEYGFEKEEDVPYQWTENAAACPVTLGFIRQYFEENDLYRIKVNILQPQGRLHLHNDSRTSGLGISDKSSDKNTTYVALAVYWPKEVVFNLGEIRIPIVTGDAYLIDFSLLHEVYNPTDEDRYYLVITGRMHNNPQWRELVINSYAKYSKMALLPKSVLPEHAGKYTQE